MRGIDVGPPTSANAARGLVDYCASEAVPEPGALPLPAHAIACALVNEPAQVVAFVLAREGLLAALDVLVSAHEWKVAPDRAGRYAVPQPAAFLTNDGSVGPALATADAETKAKCLALAREKWDSASPGARASIAACFPEERAWSEAAVEITVQAARAKLISVRGLVTNLARTIADAALVERLVIESGGIVDLEEVWTRWGMPRCRSS